MSIWWIEDKINWSGLPFAPTTASKPGLFLLNVSLVIRFTKIETVTIMSNLEDDNKDYGYMCSSDPLVLDNTFSPKRMDKDDSVYP